MAEPSISTVLRCALAELEGIMPEYDPEYEHPGWETIDVLEMRKDLTNEQAMQVIRLVDKHHDASIGVNWETLECWASTLFGDAPVEQE